VQTGHAIARKHLVDDTDRRAGHSRRRELQGLGAACAGGLFERRLWRRDLRSADGGRLLRKDASGYWTGFQHGAKDGDRYRFWVKGEGSTGYKRDPRARELAPDGFPNSFSVLREADAYPWHDAGFRTPDFSDMIVYQLHVGTSAIRSPGVASNFLDVISKIPYLADLGINVLQPLPIDEQEANPNMGYGGADLFSPDFPYVAVADLPDYLVAINGLLAANN
jgi:1,4-alpha-glucan branching enzyme